VPPLNTRSRGGGLSPISSHPTRLPRASLSCCLSASVRCPSTPGGGGLSPVSSHPACLPPASLSYCLSASVRCPSAPGLGGATDRTGRDRGRTGAGRTGSRTGAVPRKPADRSRTGAGPEPDRGRTGAGPEPAGPEPAGPGPDRGRTGAGPRPDRRGTGAGPPESFCTCLFSHYDPSGNKTVFTWLRRIMKIKFFGTVFLIYSVSFRAKKLSFQLKRKLFQL